MSSWSSQAVADGASAVWQLNEVSGHLVDIVAAANSTVETAITYGVTGTGDGDTAISLNGTSSLFSVPNNAAFALGDTFTIELFFIRSATGVSNRALVDWGHTTNNGPLIFFQSDDKIRFADSSGGTAIKTVTSAVSDTTTAHQVVWTKSGATSHAYLDGALNETAGTNVTLSTPSDVLTVGFAPGTTWFFPGTLAKIAVYKSALGASTILSHYTAATTSGSASSTGVVGYISADINGSSHIPPWIGPQNKFGRIGSPIIGNPFSVSLTAVTASADIAAGTGAAGIAAASLGVPAGNGAATGSAPGASGIPDPIASPTASTGTGAAGAAAISEGISAANAAGTGSSLAAGKTVAPTLGLASGTGSAFNALPTTGNATVVHPDAATGAGAAADISETSATTAGVGSGTGAAGGASAAIAPSVANAAGSGTQFASAPSVKTSAGVSSGTGTGWVAADLVAVAAQAAAGTGTAPQPGHRTEVYPAAATGIGRAFDVLDAGPFRLGGHGPRGGRGRNLRHPPQQATEI